MKASASATVSSAMSSAAAFFCISSTPACEHAGKAYKTVRHEFEAYGGGLTEKPEIVALSKIDTVDAATLKTQARLKRAAKHTPLRLSAASGVNVREVLRAILKEIDAANARIETPAPAVEWAP